MSKAPIPLETEGGQADGRSGGRWSLIAAALRQVVGAPDYDAYVLHCRRAGHPVRLTEREYVQAFYEAKGKTVRCC
jgi:uncharacterized short protein YbdD (DUF466 family)